MLNLLFFPIDRHAYHTEQDNYFNVDPRSVQHFGENVLALTRALLRTLPFQKVNISSEESVDKENLISYFDFLGLFVVSLSTQSFQLILMALWCGLGIAFFYDQSQILIHISQSFVNIIGDCLSALILSVIVALLLSRSMYTSVLYYSLPLTSVAVYGPVALVGLRLCYSWRVRTLPLFDSCYVLLCFPAFLSKILLLSSDSFFTPPFRAQIFVNSLFERCTGSKQPFFCSCLHTTESPYSDVLYRLCNLWIWIVFSTLLFFSFY